MLLCSVAGAVPVLAKPPPARNVVLVHGFWDTGAIFDPLVSILEKQGCRCFAPTLAPNDFRDGVRAETLRLRTAIEGRFGQRAPLIFVCMSMGGLAARDYVENFGGAARTRAMFFIVTAHRGTWWAALSPQRGVRELAAGSTFIRGLNQRVGALAGIPVRSYWTPFDLVVLPATNARWPFDNDSSQVVPGLTHPAMVRNDEVMADIAARIAGLP
jgi:triacylglycerol lipase